MENTWSKLQIVNNRRSKYCVAIPRDASRVEQTAAKELVEYVEKTCHVLLPVLEENRVQGNAIYVGHTAYAGRRNLKGDSTENWLICVCGQDVVLTGGMTKKESMDCQEKDIDTSSGDAFELW